MTDRPALLGSPLVSAGATGGVTATLPTVSDQSNPMALPLRQTPPAFRWWLAFCVVAVLVANTALYLMAPGPELRTIATMPGALLLIALILLADLYPALPWMRDSYPLDDFILSTPLSIAALMVFGPHAALVFVVAGCAMTMVMRKRWWRVLLNGALWGLQGAAAAAVMALITGSFDWTEPMSSAAMVPVTVVLAMVIEGLNVVLVGTSMRLAGAVTWRVYFVDWRSQIAVASLALTAPIPAVLAQEEPALLPLLALAMMAAQSGMTAVSSRTALAGTDPLTSVANRATLLTRLRARLSQIRTPEEAVTLLLVDLDRFKEINDDHGHLAGDEVLIEIARRLEESTRSSDLVARFGGDEFAILLSGGVSTRSVQEVADRIRGSVARPIQVQGRSVLVGVSIGSALAADKGVDPLNLLHRADDALYLAKAARAPVRGPAAAEVLPSAPATDDALSDWTEPSWSRTRPVAGQLSGRGTFG